MRNYRSRVAEGLLFFPNSDLLMTAIESSLEVMGVRDGTSVHHQGPYDFPSAGFFLLKDHRGTIICALSNQPRLSFHYYDPQGKFSELDIPQIIRDSRYFRNASRSHDGRYLSYLTTRGEAGVSEM
jgi:hypothetical protein